MAEKKMVGMEEALLTKPARDLAPREAFDLFVFLVEQGEIELLDNREAASLRPGEQVKLVPSMAGVDFLHADENNKDPSNGSTGAKLGLYLRPTPAFAVVLYRLAKTLASSKWKIEKIVWGGVGQGPGCHLTGHCVDFYGATRASGFQFDVREDWWNKPVILNKGKNKGDQHAAKRGDNWADDTNTYFRLSASNEVLDQDPRDFFADVYEFVVKECTLGIDVGAADFRSGQPLTRGTIMHPDYPFPGDPNPGRRTHNEHIHFQLGDAWV